MLIIYLEGPLLKLRKNLEFVFVFDASIIDSYPCWGCRPAFLYQFGHNQRFFGSIALTNTLPKYGDETKPYGYLIIGGGIRIF